MKNIYLKLVEMQDSDSGLTLATVTGTIGSTPQKPGSSAIFKEGMLITGTVGGGVIEGRIQEAAKKCSVSHKSQLLHLLLKSDISQKEEAICGGEIDILIDANPVSNISVFKSISNSLEKREPGVLITMVTQYAENHVLINRYWLTGSKKAPLPPDFLRIIEPEVKQILDSGAKETFKKIELKLEGEEPSSLFFLEALFPKPALVIAGAGHIGKALSHFGRMLDFEVTVLDDRHEYANPENLPEADHIIVKDIGEAMAETDINSDTFIVIVTRGHNDDAKALKPCLGSEAAYVGMIGSKGKVGRMKAEFIEKKWATEQEWSTIYAPIGLDINSITVEEIALSIAAQLVLTRNSGIR